MNVRTDITTLIRQLAKTTYWQNVYAHSKELSFKLFRNDRDFTNSQMLFLQYLNLYSNLYIEVSMGDVDEVIFKNFIYEDAYRAFKKKNRKENKKETKSRNTPVGDNKDNRSFSWVFKTPNK